MAAKLPADQKWESYDRVRLADAVNEISRSANLRYLFREILDGAGTFSSPYAMNPRETARLCGRQEVGIEIRDTLSQKRGLVALIEEEKINELIQRAAGQNPTVERGERGNDGDVPEWDGDSSSGGDYTD